MSAEQEILLVPFGEDPLHALAAHLLERHTPELPDLSRHTVLFPHWGAVPRFRRLLLEHAQRRGHSALLPPAAGTLATWPRRYADASAAALSDAAREALLWEALAEFPDLRDRFGSWALVENLLALFEELDLNHVRLPDDPDDFLRRLAAGYGIATDALSLSPFTDEARLVHTLWHAWHRHLNDHNLQDRPLMIVAGLARSLVLLPARSRIYLAGFTGFARAELEWVRAMRARGQVTLLFHGRADGAGVQPEDPVARLLLELGAAMTAPRRENPYGDFIERAYAPAAADLPTRARAQAAAQPNSPARERLVIFEADDAEHEARAVELQVRRWLIQGRTDIGIVTNDRKLARRVRALLERANIQLQDAGGWALSTTSAATALMRWLECLEHNFPHAALLDLLRSPFVNPEPARPDKRPLVAALEQIAADGNIVLGLAPYRRALLQQARKWEPRFGRDMTATLTQLIERLAEISHPLQALIHGPPRTAAEFLDALRLSLGHLGAGSAYADDEAGKQILALLDELRAAGPKLKMPWAEFRRWLLRHMERRRFRPPLQGRGVELMGPADSRLYHFDAVVIAGAIREHLPGGIDAPPFFNDGVRAQLGLADRRRRQAEAFHDFRRLLESADRVMVSLSRERRGEALAASPWVDRLRAFQHLAYGHDLEDQELVALLRTRETLITARGAAPAPPQPQPAPSLPSDLMPAAFSATSLQHLLDCPYQFYGLDGLGLAPAEAAREELEKSDFGRRVHRIMQAFRSGIPGLPGPWNKPLNQQTLPEAEALLTEISRAVFAPDLGRSFDARGWLYRWLDHIPALLAWELARGATWRPHGTEVKLRRTLAADGARVTLEGRLDRLDRGPDGYAIIDYKTGAAPNLEQVGAGEQIQLPFYALLADERVAETLYLILDDGGVNDRIRLEGEALRELAARVLQRLFELKQALDRGAGMPAWGDSKTCAVCWLEGLCRKEMWPADVAG